MNSHSLPPGGDNQNNEFVGRLLIGGVILFLLGILLFFQGCTPKGWDYLHDGEVKHDTTIISVRDSIHHYERDSIFIKEKGDTVYKYVEKWRYRDRWHHDTLVRVRVDSVAVIQQQIVEVPKPLSEWQKFQIGGFWCLCGAVLLLLAWCTRKWWLRLF